MALFEVWEARYDGFAKLLALKTKFIINHKRHTHPERHQPNEGGSTHQRTADSINTCFSTFVKDIHF